MNEIKLVSGATKPESEMVFSAPFLDIGLTNPNGCCPKDEDYLLYTLTNDWFSKIIKQ